MLQVDVLVPRYAVLLCGEYVVEDVGELFDDVLQQLLLLLWRWYLDDIMLFKIRVLFDELGVHEIVVVDAVLGLGLI